MHIIHFLIATLFLLPIFNPTGEQPEASIDPKAPDTRELAAQREKICGGEVTPNGVRLAYHYQANRHLDLAASMAERITAPTKYMTVVRVGEMAYGPRMETADTPFYAEGLLDEADRKAEEVSARLAELVSLELEFARVAMDGAKDWEDPTKAQRELSSGRLADICNAALWESRGPDRFDQAMGVFTDYLERHDIRPIDPDRSTR